MRTELVISSVTGQQLEAYIWRPDSENVKGVIQLVHGMSEHIIRYDEAAQAFNRAGFVVVGHTHLGHGERAARLGYFAEKNGWEALIGDTHAVRLAVSRDYPELPYFMLGHSMGSFVVRSYCLKHEKGLSGVILSGTGHQPPALLMAGLAVAKIQALFGMGHKPGKLLNKLSFGSYNKGFAPARTEYDWLTTDEKEVDKYVADPLCGFPFTVYGYRDMFEGIRELTPEHLVTMDKAVPVLLFSGDKDPVGENGKGVRITAKELEDAGVKDVTVTLYEGGRHEMFNERDRARVLSDIVAWMEARLS